MANKLNFNRYIPLLALFVAVIALLFGDDIVGKLRENSSKKQNTQSYTKKESDTRNKYQVDTLDIIIRNTKLPYLRKVPIIDKGLFVEYHYSEFHFGGVNIEFVKFNVMSDEGEIIKIEFDKEKGYVKMPVFENPQLEFSYKNKIYLISINNENIQSFYYSIVEISNARMELNKSISQFSN